MVERDFESELTALFPQGEVMKSHLRQYWVNVDASGLRSAVVSLREKLGISHLTTIVGEDMRDHFLLSYVLAGPQVVVVLKVKVDRTKAEVPSLAPVLDGAIVYEREIHDLFGIVPTEHPDLRRQVLPEDWPKGIYPLRKDAVIPKASAPGEEPGEKS